MSRILFTEEEVQLASERQLKYIGTAKVNISQIQFDPPLPRDLDDKNLDRLRRVFRQNHCRRLDVDNHVPAIVSPHDLANALRKANVSQQSLLTTDARQLPRISFLEGQLLGLHGRHRVQAGAEVLPPADRWWTVDLYSDDIGAELRTSLVEEYANERKPTDGEIYRKIRQYEGDYDETFRERWFETITYLQHIWDFWSSLVASDHASLKKIDQNTVNPLQLLAPGKSRTDGRTACGMILSGQAFAEFSDEERRIIWSRMQNFDGLIPSLYTFFEDFKYLETCAHCVKRLCGPIDMSIWRTMSSIFIPPSEEGTATSGAVDSLIQTSESTFRRQQATDMERLETGYLQIWLYAMRHYTLMPPDPKSDDELLAKSTRSKPDERAIYEMAELAHQLGFQSTEIDALIKSSPDHQIARSALLQARKPHRYRYDSQDFDLLVNSIVSCFAKAVSDRPEQPQGLLADSAMKPKTRAGEPQTRTHKQDGPLLFLDRLHADVEVADNVTSFFVRRCVYFAFFGKSARVVTSNVDQAEDTDPDQGMGEIPPSPMFVEEDDPPVTHTPAPDPQPPHGHQGGPQQQIAEVIMGRRDSESQQPLRTDQKENARRRRRRNFQIHPAVSRPAGDMDREPMELELPDEIHDQVILNQSSSPEENPMSVGPQSQPEPVEPAMAITLFSPASAVPDVEDSRSDCTQVSLDVVPLVEDQEEQKMAEEANKDDAPDEQTRVDGEVRRVSPESEANNSSVYSQPPPENLDEFLAGLRRAQEEQEQLEERLENERLHQELGELEQPRNGKPSPQEDRQDSSPLRLEYRSEEPAHGHVVDAVVASDAITHEALVEPLRPGTPGSAIDPHPTPPVAEDTSVPDSSVAGLMPSRAVEQRPPQQHIEIELWSLERGEWRRSDRLRVDPSDPSPLERVAQKYLWKNYSLYDKNLHNLRPAQCYRAATADGSNAFFIVSEYEEKKLAAEGRVVKEKKLLGMASRVLDRVEGGRYPRFS
ncbi:hypothetical protein N7537_011408 [Penicillium hordei]|uniref:Uncharacterized protein n=1 Tax=Penicillium hordei TaxID=40994 RepID=A0AAD6DMD2_9EURO|nr:uncharacterized protein N7537_011408 [Penicillium hordei]KAJ5588730.1 hypothetical protein N7537_011408 [Penicillium hordei]